jgi:positive regulator of sigma E activity
MHDGDITSPPLLTIVVGLLLSLLGFWAAQRYQRRSIEAEFTVAADEALKEALDMREGERWEP